MRRVDTAKGPVKLTDEHGLYLRVSPRGAKTWIQRLNIQGSRTDNSIGRYPAMTLAEARAVAFERWKVALGGGDPRVEGGKPTGPTFQEAADEVIAMHEPSWRSPKSGQVWRSSLDTYVHPVIGDLPVAEVTPGHVMSVLQPIWSDKRETARRVKQRISAICRWAVAQGHRSDDPAGIVIDAALPRGEVKVQHLPALPYGEVAQCLATVKASRGASASSKLALEFLILTAARSGEVRKATWDEIELGGAVWTLPAERMKANREHRVPPLVARCCSTGGSHRVVRRRRAGVSRHAARQTSEREHALEAAPRARLRDGDARVSVQLSGLGSRADQRAARGHGGGACAHDQEQGRGRLRAQRSLREAARLDGVLVGLPRGLIARPSVGSVSRARAPGR